MGQVSGTGAGGWTSLNINRLYSPTAGSGAVGNNAIMVGANAGSNSITANLIVIGVGAGAAGIGTGTLPAGLPGTIIIGNGAGASLTSNAVAGGSSSLLIGNNAAAAAGGLDSCTLIGESALAAMPGNGLLGGPNRVTALGCKIMPAMVTAAGGSVQNSVFIGDHIGASGPSAGIAQIVSSVFIGSSAGAGIDTWGVAPHSQNTVVGANAMSQNNLTSSGANVVVGASAFQGPTGTPQNNVVLGTNAGGTVVPNATNNVSLGHNCAIGQDRCVFIGMNILGTTLGGLSRVIAIGAGAGFGAVGTNDSFYVETYDQVTQRTLLYGRLDLGNLMLGNTSANRADIQGGGATNVLKIANGTVGIAPTGGGYFYVSAGALHWRGPVTDTVVAPA